jgi:hypothetical protein
VNPYNLVPELLAAAPELKAEYEEMAEEARQARALWTEADHEEMESLATMLDLPPKEQRDIVGHTIVLETLFVPFTISLLEGRGTDRLRELTAWVERLLATEDKNVVHTVGVSVVEPWLTTYQSCFPQLVPFLGPYTRRLCRTVATGFRLPPEVNKVLRAAMEDQQWKL